MQTISVLALSCFYRRNPKYVDFKVIYAQGLFGSFVVQQLPYKALLWNHHKNTKVIINNCIRILPVDINTEVLCCNLNQKRISAQISRKRCSLKHYKALKCFNLRFLDLPIFLFVHTDHSHPLVLCFKWQSLARTYLLKEQSWMELNYN